MSITAKKSIVLSACVTQRKLEDIASQIEQLKQDANAMLQLTKDVWSPLGRRAPMLREVFRDVSLPVGSRDELLKKMGGENQVFTAPDLDGRMTAVAAADFVDALGDFVDKVVPLKAWEVLVQEIIRHERGVRLEGGKHLLRKIGNNKLLAIMSKTESLAKVFPHQVHRNALNAFETRRPAYEALVKKRRTKDSTVLLARKIAAFQEYAFVGVVISILEILIGIITSDDENVDVVFAKSGSSIIHLNNAEQLINAASAYLQNVINATQLTSTVTNYNTQAQNAIDSASQLTAQGIADLALAEAAAQQIPGNAKAQAAVAEAQAKLEQVQNQLTALILQMAQAEAHKDVLSIPEICITIRCIEEDPCCDDDWNNVNVCIQNTSNTDVQQKCGTTSGNGSVTICGRFGESNIVVTTTGPSGWNVTRSYSTGNQSVSYTIKTDLSGWE